MATILNGNGCANLTLKEAYQRVKLDQPNDIPWVIKIFENPSSPVALPGNISLHDHDCIHILLGRGVTPKDEAFVIGFSMGCDCRTQLFHRIFLKFLTRFIYPPKYRFGISELKVFDLGFSYGRSLIYSDIFRLDFTCFYDYKISTLRSLLGIDLQVIDDLINLK